MKKLFLLFSISILTNISNVNAQFSVQNALLEVYTGSWNQYWPDGNVIMNNIVNTYPSKAFAVTIHQSDPMANPDCDSLINFYYPNYPEGQINRGVLVSRGQWTSGVSTKVQGAAYVTVSFDSVSFNSQTRVLDVYLHANFTGPYTAADMRFNCIVVEDSVIGSGNSYDQANADNGTPGHPYNGAGNPIVGFPHRYVARKYLGGPWGTAGVIPSTANFGTTASHHYTYTIPAMYDATKISLIGIVSEYGATQSDRTILNVGNHPSISTALISSVKQIAKEDKMSVYPNPSNGTFWVSTLNDCLMTVYASDGKKVKETHLKSGVTEVEVEQADGFYFLRFVSGESILTKKIMVL
ncbi:MAG: Omp28-related outer membrane protein [Aureispira sp.]|nr:Omp28-related outer membrane protein [Aureispira sp.]